MVVKRPGIITILAILAFVAAALSGYKLLIYLGIVPPSLGAVAFFGVNSLGALATAIKFAVLLAMMYGLWTMKPWGWLLTLIVAIYGLFLAVFEWISQSSLFPVAADVLVYGLILLSILSPRARNAFAEAEKQRKGEAQ
jgi:uncharacterized membrane protein (DUF2068 family)